MSRAARLRRYLYVRIVTDGYGEMMQRLVSIGGHMAFTGDRFTWQLGYCLDEETHEEDGPEGFRDYGGGRLDCCDGSQWLAPEALAFCRAVMRWIDEARRLWMGMWPRPWLAPD